MKPYTSNPNKLIAGSFLVLLLFSAFAGATYAQETTCEITDSEKQLIVEHIVTKEKLGSNYTHEFTEVNCKEIEGQDGRYAYMKLNITSDGETRAYDVSFDEFNNNTLENNIAYYENVDYYARYSKVFTDKELSVFDYDLLKRMYDLEKGKGDDELIWVGIYPHNYGFGVVNPALIDPNGPAVSYLREDAVVANTPTTDVEPSSVSNDDVVSSRMSILPVFPRDEIDCDAFKQDFTALVNEKNPNDHFYYYEKSGDYCMGLMQVRVSEVRGLMKDFTKGIGFFGTELTFSSHGTTDIEPLSEEAFQALADSIRAKYADHSYVQDAYTSISLWKNYGNQELPGAYLYVNIYGKTGESNVQITVGLSGEKADEYVSESEAYVETELAKLGITVDVTLGERVFEERPMPVDIVEPSAPEPRPIMSYKDYYYEANIVIPRDLEERLSGWERMEFHTETLYSMDNGSVIFVQPQIMVYGIEGFGENTYFTITPTTVSGLVGVKEYSLSMANAELTRLATQLGVTPTGEWNATISPQGNYAPIYYAYAESRDMGGRSAIMPLAASSIPAPNIPQSSDGQLEKVSFSGTDTAFPNMPAINNGLFGIPPIAGVILLMGVVGLWLYSRH